VISELEARAMHDSVWTKLATRLPPHVRLRYQSQFQAMERYEAVFEAVGAAGAYLRRVLGKGCRAMARLFDHAARRLLLAR
jgi:hypothetical protein